MFGAATQFRQQSAAEHIPALKDDLVIEMIYFVAQRRVTNRECDAAEWIGIDDARRGTGSVDGIDTLNRGFDQLNFQFPTAPGLMRRKETDIAGSPGKKGWLIDRRERADLRGLPRNEAGDGMTVIGKARREVSRKEIHIILVAEVEQIVDDLDLVAFRRRKKRLDGREVISSAPINQGPADNLAYSLNTYFAQQPVILLDKQIVLRGADLIYPLPVPVVSRAAFKPGLKEAFEFHSISGE